MLAQNCQTRSGHPIKKFRVKPGNLLISQTSEMVSNFFDTQSPLPCAAYRILSSDSFPSHGATSTVTHQCQLQLKWQQRRQTVTNLTSLILRSINLLVTTLSQSRWQSVWQDRCYFGSSLAVCLSFRVDTQVRHNTIFDTALNSK